ncbi:MAG: chemotaxis-specific protein-glutamate methyltransferase CheB [Bacteroidia bacterium]|nr:chemotaxis-specific protein-glutamate methyltransferase CheB [Bacteroidia bacterium]
MSEKSNIRVLIVDDRIVVRNLLAWIIEREPGMTVAGIARNGEEAVRQTALLNPDVVSMDIEMPQMNGIEATKRLMEQSPVPIVIASSRYKPGETALSMEVLAAGAVAIVEKPAGPGHLDHERQSRHFIRTLRAMAGVKVIRRRQLGKQSELSFQGNVNEKLSKAKEGTYRILVIGASAGGPEGVQIILKRLPPSFPLPVAVVQHIDLRFAEGYCHWLSETTGKEVHIVNAHTEMLPGKVYLTAIPRHLVIVSKELIGVSDDLPAGGHKPAVARLFSSAYEAFGGDVIAVLLSGMGRDGAAELKQLRDAGAYTIIQDEQSCLVFGMPGEAAKLNAHMHALPPHSIADLILKLVKNYSA